jgi:hypothetical protein
VRRRQRQCTDPPTQLGHDRLHMGVPQHHVETKGACCAKHEGVKIDSFDNNDIQKAQKPSGRRGPSWWPACRSHAPEASLGCREKSASSHSWGPRSSRWWTQRRFFSLGMASGRPKCTSTIFTSSCRPSHRNRGNDLTANHQPVVRSHTPPPDWTRNRIHAAPESTRSSDGRPPPPASWARRCRAFSPHLGRVPATYFAGNGFAKFNVAKLRGKAVPPDVEPMGRLPTLLLGP